MDDDLKEVLEAIRKENADAHAETRRLFQIEQLKNAEAHAETRRRFGTLEARFETAQAENAEAHFKTRQKSELIAESHQHKLDLVIERVLSNGEKIDQLEAKVDQVTSNHESRITRLEISASLHGQL
jgi:formyltetrahydrofolate hydrolase